MAFVFGAEPLADGVPDYARPPVAHGRELFAALQQNISPIIHLVNFPSLSINHSMVVFDGVETRRGFEFQAYDPNDPQQPSSLTFDREAQTFFLPGNLYWVGGSLNIIEIYRRWWL